MTVFQSAEKFKRALLNYSPLALDSDAHGIIEQTPSSI